MTLDLQVQILSLSPILSIDSGELDFSGETDASMKQLMIGLVWVDMWLPF